MPASFGLCFGSKQKGVSVYLRTIFVLLLLCVTIIGFPGVDDAIPVTVDRHNDGFLVVAVFDAAVLPRTAWDVLNDYDHMASVIHNLAVSKITGRQGNTLWLKQEGAAKYGPFSFPFQSEREIHLIPISQIVVKQLSGTLRSMHSETRIESIAAAGPDQLSGVRITYRAEIVPDSIFGRLFGGRFVRDGVEEQFLLLVAEMKRREGK
jgi:hypothetical protein